MARSLLFLSLFLPAVASAAPSDSNAASTPVRRLALLVGVNDGGPGRAKLRYAVTDANSFGQVLEELGGVQPQDRLMMLEGDRPALESALARFKAMVAAAKSPGGRTEALIYYSGHSDEEGLLLHKDRFGYRELRQALEQLPADVRIAILDSCASGTLARQKGGVRRPAFLVDASTAVRGHAILTSSSEDEVSQESDRIGGSFFTHNLVSGMRGAADATGDGRVTLHEAYQFAFHETLARTERTRGGAQHPAYDIELAGTGELVMTDLRTTSAVLVVGEGVEGRLFIRDQPGRLVVELNKLAGRSTELGLQPGHYTVMRESRGASSQAKLVVDKGGRTVLADSAFLPMMGELTAMRGGSAGAGGDSLAMTTPVEGTGRHRRFLNLGLLPKMQTNSLFGDTDVDNALSFSLGVASMGRLDGFALAMGANWNADSIRGVQTSLGINVVHGNVNGAQFTVGGNWARGAVEGAQFAVGGNWAGERVEGIQAAVGANVARKGGYLGQFAVGASVSSMSMKGAQLSVGTSWVEGDFEGYQASVGLNMVRGHMKGIQMSSGVNYVASANGAQFSLLNIGGDVRGMQLGIVNIAGKMNGLQLGLINVSQEMESGIPVGLLNIVRNGQFHVEAYGSDFNYANVSLKVGSRYLYTALVVGMGSIRTRGPSHWSTGVGIGGHIPLTERFFVDVDVVSNNIHDWEGSEGNRLLHQARLMVGYQVASHFAIIAGPTANLLHGFDGDPVAPLSHLGTAGSTTNKEALWWPGLQVGLRI
ncbi:ICE-like protease [Myxococcus stipitatus DSM 14675]|uniref:ICE-like protease n=1 Tax=Myxococcus stipitatus (strain DSM 14675 / JCM 12634 / Mx s8) TaxID=1278073 RepID=L7UAT6_MYXSD|nr:caspase family protein [Myxococcus stipitatus]AGC46021.1 ICE-like protease [Myxococcus stipitatus DSM 14675]